ncbi:hypothetical protein GYMLUDRAFT_48119 [Collybiopsis luxurians FD-317 M1]|uniref:triacylglycerol lipase n=1 Tax=Collybiopsis luxurians FD-317 M1 TaxID=944289 RepID=A0A0D0BKB4_9AGAR|nr:hypothetical protein GYMLUDRAFT_48119 [Collybiopsis luxurians FD-317 M1]
MLPSIILQLIDFFLSSSSSNDQRSPSTPLQLELRHQHAVDVSGSSPHVIFQDVPAHLKALSLSSSQADSFVINTRPTSLHKPSHYDYHSQWQARVHSMKFGQCQTNVSSWNWDWEEISVPGPDIESRKTLLQLAKMANNAYVEPGDAAWYDLGGKFNSTYPFGWEPDADGFRGQVFATEDNSTVVVSIKGTSAGVFGGGKTAKKDKLNDNLLFSCCCARVDWTWSTVCGCYRGGWKCDQRCVEDALIEESLFYSIGINLYNNLTYIYPDSNIWVIGHSLGGALASLIGITFGAPVVAFESPGERMAASRLHLPSPPSTHHVTHVYHTADPIAMGTCNGVLSSCALGGYAMESRCHLGKSIIFDTVSNSSWAVDIRTHTIVTVIEKILSDPWPPSVEIGREVPETIVEDDCVECYSWEFGSFPDKSRVQKGQNVEMDNDLY